jgi:hypothetical protein
LADGVDKEADGVDKVGNDEDADRVSRLQSSPALECQKIYSTADEEHGKRGQTQEPHG